MMFIVKFICIIYQLTYFIEDSNSELLGVSAFEWSRYDNYILQGFEISTWITRSTLECAAKCKNHDRCLSFNFIRELNQKGDNGTCELNSVSIPPQGNPLPGYNGKFSYSKEAEYYHLKMYSGEQCEVYDQGLKHIYVANRGKILYNVYCDKDWVVTIRRTDASIDMNRNWAEYRDGFGDLNGQFWMGLELHHQLTYSGDYEMIIGITSWNGNYYELKYSAWRIQDEASSFTVDKITIESRNTSDPLGVVEILNHKFVTQDRLVSGQESCPTNHGGGWWFDHCSRLHLTGHYPVGGTCPGGSSARCFKVCSVDGSNCSENCLLKNAFMKIRKKQ